MTMKKFIILLAVLFVGMATFAQSPNKVVSITVDTLTKIETEYFVVQPITGTYKSLAIQALFTQLGGTSDGTATLQGSIDGTSYQTINSSTKAVFSTNDTLTITNGAVWNVYLDDPQFVYYRIAATGTANDTTLVTPKYIIKK